MATDGLFDMIIRRKENTAKHYQLRLKYLAEATNSHALPPSLSRAPGAVKQPSLLGVSTRQVTGDFKQHSIPTQRE
jgi:hypothetical protein